MAGKGLSEERGAVYGAIRWRRRRWVWPVHRVEVESKKNWTRFWKLSKGTIQTLIWILDMNLWFKKKKQLLYRCFLQKENLGFLPLIGNDEINGQMEEKFGFWKWCQLQSMIVQIKKRRGTDGLKFLDNTFAKLCILNSVLEWRIWNGFLVQQGIECSTAAVAGVWIGQFRIEKGKTNKAVRIWSGDFLTLYRVRASLRFSTRHCKW